MVDCVFYLMQERTLSVGAYDKTYIPKTGVTNALTLTESCSGVASAFDTQ